MLHPSHNPALVVLSIIVACIASYAALQLAGRIVEARRIRVPWLLGSAFTMGIGIWSMHFVAMLAFRLDVPVAYSDRKSTRLNSSHGYISYAVFCLKKKNLNSS